MARSAKGDQEITIARWLKMQGRLLELIDRLDEVDDSDRYDPPTIYAEGGHDAAPTARAVICAGDDEGTWA
jgi:hypothetical protein